jgi:hypothetical protein
VVGPDDAWCRIPSTLFLMLKSLARIGIEHKMLGWLVVAFALLAGGRKKMVQQLGGTRV